MRILSLHVVRPMSLRVTNPGSRFDVVPFFRQELGVTKLGYRPKTSSTLPIPRSFRLFQALVLLHRHTPYWMLYFHL
jgi:hypothetical protein